ncbi:hypothetical protein G8A07_14725 [Roseateles sp. DAIF2]|uniref:hypothetical protein n=1 Tax=Roseateles sp. DAIF2 TaxID=2714952 RepID=UPI0018A29BF1|nr:hypothetical protein [Roseateles sp. DAIF2]QPF74045.1 hypothetical protein G8A07_14725 [Roseateles sp. DAIF2]
MNIPIETKPALWGAAAGAVALAVIGFTWGGWTTGSRSEALAQARANDAVVTALAPVCTERFERASDVEVQRVALLKTEVWSQGDFVEKGGWAAGSTAGNPPYLTAVANACAALLVKAAQPLTRSP